MFCWFDFCHSKSFGPPSIGAEFMANKHLFNKTVNSTAQSQVRDPEKSRLGISSGNGSNINSSSPCTDLSGALAVETDFSSSHHFLLPKTHSLFLWSI
jgi:hypothetical protein